MPKSQSAIHNLELNLTTRAKYDKQTVIVLPMANIKSPATQGSDLTRRTALTWFKALCGQCFSFHAANHVTATLTIPLIPSLEHIDSPYVERTTVRRKDEDTDRRETHCNKCFFFHTAKIVTALYMKCYLNN